MEEHHQLERVQGVAIGFLTGGVIASWLGLKLLKNQLS